MREVHPVTDEEFVPVLSTTEDQGEFTEGLLGTEFNTDRNMDCNNGLST